MQDTIDSLLDGLSELIYISDPHTHQLLYLNKPGREIYGEDITRAGSKCYAALQGREEPCPFCTNNRLKKDTYYEWEFTNPLTNRHYLLRDKLVEWNGQDARLEIAFDVTDRQRESNLFRFLADAGVMTVECIRALEARDDFTQALDDALGMLGTFLQADRAYLFDIDGACMSNTHEWCAPGVTSQIDQLQNLPVALIRNWTEYFSRGEVVVIDNVEALKNTSRNSEYDDLYEQGIRSLVSVPITIGDVLVGYLGVDNPRRGGQLEIIEKPLVTLASFISSRKKRELERDKVAQLTWRDPLTGVRSRAAFYRDFDRGNFCDIGFALVDADRLSVVNREGGRLAGDKILQAIASCMTAVFGNEVYRIGDDEFCAVKVNADYSAFAEQAENAAECLSSQGIPASLGSAWHATCTQSEGLLELAGERMRNAKRGRHRAVDLGVDLASDAAVSSLLRPGGAQLAAEAKRLDIFLMPQSIGEAGQVVSAEALIRYRDTQRGMSALPSAFVPALEDMGEIAAIDFFALSRACETIGRWQQEGLRAIPLAVNFSRRTMSEPCFAQRVEETVSSYGIDRSLLEIEITESAREEDAHLFRAVLDDLRARGFRVAIDDFGVENANFLLFIQLEFDVLKIDKSMVWGLGSEDRTMQVISGLVALCDEMGIETVAEGIETKEQHEALCEAGCTRAQGYLIGKPQPIKEFEQTFLR